MSWLRAIPPLLKLVFRLTARLPSFWWNQRKASKAFRAALLAAGLPAATVNSLTQTYLEIGNIKAWSAGGD